MSATVEFKENQLWIDEDVWNDLRGGTETAVFSNVVAAVGQTMKRGGAFIIHREDTGVMRRFDRISEFEEFVRGINETRIQLGLEPVAS